jgi:ParB family chromosome partitioning protein
MVLTSHRLSPEDAEEYTQALGQIFSGSWRQIALAFKLGVPESLGLGRREWVEQRLGGYIRLSISERHEAVAELASDGMSTREIGDVLGVDHSTVVKDNNGENSPPNELTDDDELEVYGENSPPKKPHVANNSGENEWYTPPEYVEAARSLMGVIDVDPASSDKANELIQAKAYYTIETDGLKQRWNGNVWLNPPYAQPLVDKFSKALTTKYKIGETKQACVLVNNATETEWFQRIMKACTAICFIKGRVKFLDPDGAASGAPLQGQVIIYLGENRAGFAAKFSDIGKILYA